MVTASHNENGWTGVKMGIRKSSLFSANTACVCVVSCCVDAASRGGQLWSLVSLNLGRPARSDSYMRALRSEVAVTCVSTRESGPAILNICASNTQMATPAPCTTAIMGFSPQSRGTRK